MTTGPDRGEPMTGQARTAYEHSAHTTAPAGTVWRNYTDLARWPRWNAAVEAVALDGPFAAGATGTLTPPGAEPLPFRIVAAEPGRGYTSETDIAETVTLRSTSSLEAAADGGTRIHQRSELVGPAAPYFAASFGPALAAGVPRTVETLAAHASREAPAPAPDPS
jgi:uncharacterized protein YndB with AHSA1/START domain